MRSFVFKPVGSRIWRARIKLDSDAKILDVSLRTSDKQVAEKRLRELVMEKEREAGGILAPKEIREAAKGKLVDHLDTYLRHLSARGQDSMYVYIIEKRVSNLLNECAWEYVRDITPNSFTSWLIAQTDKAPKTRKQYFDAMSGFLKWMQRLGRIADNPLASVDRVPTKGREVRHRRAFSDNEIRNLLNVATPPHRALYLVAVFTGLRKAELEALTWGDVTLTGETPHVRARASTTKNHKEAVLYLHPDAVEALRDILPASVDSAAPVFGKVPRPEQFRKDLEKARITYKDVQGRQADFHALRYTFATNLARAGVNPRVAMEAMRHSEMRLTQNVYTDATQLGTFDAVKTLPSLLPLIASPDLGAGCLSVARGGTVPFTHDSDNSPENKGSSHDLAPTGTDGHNGGIGCRTRIRT